MKILHIIDSTGFYGAESMLLTLMEEQQRRGLFPTLLSTNDPHGGDNAIEVESKKRGLATTQIIVRKGFSVKSALRILAYAHDNAFDIIHSHGYKINILLGFLPRFVRKIPIVSTVHGYMSVRRYSKMWFYKIIDRIALARLDARVHVYSSATMKADGTSPKKPHTHVVHNGIPELRFDHDSRIKADPDIAAFCSDGFVIGTLCRLSPEKGLDCLIQAIQSLAHGAGGIKALVIGEGPQRASLQKMIDDAKLSHTILLAGYRTQAYDYLPLFKAFVLPSLTEGLPITILEAMQANVPIIATRVGGIPEALEYGAAGILIDPGNPTALADAINRIQSEPKKARDMAARARSRALQMYSCEKMAEEYLTLYQHVLR